MLVLRVFTTEVGYPSIHKFKDSKSLKKTPDVVPPRREDTRFSCHETGGWDTLMGEDQEDYYAAGDYEGDEDGGDERGGAGKKARQEGASKKGQRGVDPSGQGGGSKGRKGQGIVARGLKQRGGGVKKPREKSAAAALKGAKSKPKPNAKPKGKASALKTRKK